MRDRIAAVAAALVVTALAGCGGGDGGKPSGKAGAGGQQTAEAQPVSADADGVLRDEQSGFSVEAPEGFQLTVRDGVYVLQGGDRSLAFSRTATDRGAAAFGDELLAQLGGDVVSRDATGDGFSAEVDRDGVRNTVIVSPEPGALAVMTARSPSGDPFPLELVRQVLATVSGGYTLSPPAAQDGDGGGGDGGGGSGSKLALQRYSSGGVTGLVPAGPEWSINDNQGSLEGSSPQGSFLFGFSIDVMLPQNAPAGFNGPVAPFLDPASALTQVMPALAPTIGGYQITRVVAENVLPSFTASAMLQFTYSVNGQPWTGAALVATDSPEKYSNYTWKYYYSGIGVPSGSDGSVGAGLLEAWRSWNPSGAIAQRSAQAQQLMQETNDVWKDVSEFRSRTADRQSRDVGCLLQGYYDVEDNSRKYDLPPLPCDQQYVPAP